MTNSNQNYISFINPNPEDGNLNSRGWKTKNGYRYESKKLSTCILRNNRQLRQFVTINIDTELSESQHKLLWNYISKSLSKAGVNAVYIREMNSAGTRLHYHLLTINITDCIPDIIRNAVPKALSKYLRVHVEFVKNQFAVARYFTKCSKNHKNKIRVFAKYVRMNKCGSIGKFWPIPKEQIWQNIIRYERKLSLYKSEETYEQSRQLYDLIDGYNLFCQEDGFALRMKIERNLAWGLMMNEKIKNKPPRIV